MAQQEQLKVGVPGCAGRMGQELLKLGAAEESAGKCRVVGGTLAPDDNAAHDLEINILSAQELVAQADVIIDFTPPSAALSYAKACAQHGKLYVGGSTGFDAEQKKQLQELAKQTPMFWAPNMSIGINVMKRLVRQTAHLLDDEFDIEVVEMHHRNKVDAPSGGALMFGQEAAMGRGIDFDENAILSREGITGVRPRGAIGFSSIRGGDVIGDHTVMFAGPNERLEITHKSASRTIYAKGAYRAAYWLKQQEPGKLYGMDDLLNS